MLYLTCKPGQGQTALLDWARRWTLPIERMCELLWQCACTHAQVCLCLSSCVPQATGRQVRQAWLGMCGLGSCVLNRKKRRRRTLMSCVDMRAEKFPPNSRLATMRGPAVSYSSVPFVSYLPGVPHMCGGCSVWVGCMGSFVAPA
eukprot:366560-Chlamydomonas_euryale.AAC.2